MNTVLVVDDSKFMRQQIKDVFSSMKTYSCIEAENGTDAIRAFVKYKPDIVTLDYEMPGINGVDTAMNLLKLNTTSKMIIITSIKSNLVAQKVSKIPQLGYLTKPVDPQMIQQTLTKLEQKMKEVKRD
ncbi:CheY-like receiver [Candidatus Nitrosarchaeum limnium SFB1]|jgi:YesN/AraC family two-component response regulator|uniref:CheY-like receiver n=1 Tax=Candidatus Nitrosarchaeum limnium SFB1 TaxID=886738 RepID=F3KJX0_9ARCH|nr:CheY-like receiver [Candidatus Nitrosarchaeum limnium SFB1]